MSNVKFGGRPVAIVGVLGGCGLGLGMTWMMLVYGQSLGATVQTILIILALLAGGLIAVVAAFFGLVIPSNVGHSEPEHTGEPKA